MKSPYRLFILPTLLSILLLAGVFIFFGGSVFATALLLVVLEITLSFDNAVVNAKVLESMTPVWQKRFLTWGMLIAVVGTRIILPILIVSFSVSQSPLVVARLAAFDPAMYGHLLEGAHAAISSFGGMFLLLIALKYFFDDGKDVHWIQDIEARIAKWGQIEAIELGIALFVLLGISRLASHEASIVLFAGGLGILTFIAMHAVANAFSVENVNAATGGMALFLYLNVLDAAFSLDGVIGAFAITTSLAAIVVGLGVGAYFVRSLTIFLVREKTLDTLTYVEHGAHWAIFGLAGSMLVSIFVPVPEVVTGLIGIIFIIAAFASSFRERNAARVLSLSN